MEIALIVVLAAAAIGAVFYPLVRREAGAPDPILIARPDDPLPTRQEVDRYRNAIRSGTLCSGCGLANPHGSRFCAECGRRLATPVDSSAASGAAVRPDRTSRRRK